MDANRAAALPGCSRPKEVFVRCSRSIEVDNDEFRRAVDAERQGIAEPARNDEASAVPVVAVEAPSVEPACRQGAAAGIATDDDLPAVEMPGEDEVDAMGGAGVEIRGVVAEDNAAFRGRRVGVGGAGTGALPCRDTIDVSVGAPDHEVGLIDAARYAHSLPCARLTEASARTVRPPYQWS